MSYRRRRRVQINRFARTTDPDPAMPVIKDDTDTWLGHDTTVANLGCLWESAARRLRLVLKANRIPVNDEAPELLPGHICVLLEPAEFARLFPWFPAWGFCSDTQYLSWNSTRNPEGGPGYLEGGYRYPNTAEDCPQL